MSDSHGQENPIKHPEVQLASNGGYIAGFILTLGLMFTSLELVSRHVWGPFKLTVATSVAAFAAVVLQSYLLFRLDLSRTQRWNTFALIIMIPLFVLIIALTWWMFQSLGARTMIHGMGM
ncbi:MAG: hypothetical protein M0Z44_07500 [Gammaproteobacteria bacterium]|nr:hypothetical protein [Gammaproteobacteria bacterium]